MSQRARCPSIFSSTAIELSAPRDEFHSIEPTVGVALRRGFKKPVQSSLISVTPGTRIFKCGYISLYLHNWAVLRLCIVFSIGESPRVCSKYLSRCDRIPFESKGALSVNFSSIAIELNVPRDEFSLIAIEPTVRVALRRGFKTNGSVLSDIGDSWDKDF